MFSQKSRAGRHGWLAAILLLAAGSLSAATKLPSFPAKPADIDLVKWMALQSAVIQVFPPSTELTASDGVQGDNFGYSVAVSGTTALVGAFGAVYVFTFNGTTWVQQQKLTASDAAAQDRFGTAVALDGATALVGADAKTVGSNAGQGAAYVFTFNGTMWSQQQQLTASDGAANDSFGFSVSLSGTTALVGARNKTIGSNVTQGAAYVFTLSNGTWSQQQELTATDGAAGEEFGTSVVVSSTTALVGAYGSNVQTDAGAVYVFSFTGSSWNQQQALTASDGAAGDRFGVSVALSGTTALVGANGHTVGSNGDQGAAYVFTFNGSSWSQQQELTASDGVADDLFGVSVALSGNSALVGAIETLSVTEGGAAYVFTFNGNAWVQQQELTGSAGAGDYAFGSSVAMSGSTGLVGAPYTTIGSNVDQGAAYVFNPVSDTIFCDGFDGMGLCK